MRSNYPEILKKWKEDKRISNLEYKIWSFIFTLTQAKIPPLKLLPIHYKFFLIYLFSFLMVGIVGIVFFVGCALFLDETIKVVVCKEATYRIFALIAIITVLLFFLFLPSDSALEEYFYRHRCWRVNAGNEMLSRKEHIFLIGIIGVTVLLSILFFKSRFIIFALNAFLILVIYEAFRQFSMYVSVKNWQRNKLHFLSFHIDEKEEISDGMKKVKLYSLQAKYRYFYKNKEYCSSQIFIDEPRDRKLFKSLYVVDIKRWIEEHKHIDVCYVNPQKPWMAVLEKNILTASLFGKVVIISFYGDVYYKSIC